MPTPIIKRLPSGYWLVQWSQNRWIQWPVWERPTGRDAFGWVTEDDFQTAERLVREEETKCAGT